MTDHPDEELMRMATNGDVPAFDELYRRYNQPVFNFFYRMVWNADDAEDFTQETFLRLWRGRGQYAGRGRFSTYLFEIAKNHFLDRRRRQAARIELQYVSEGGPGDPVAGCTSSNNACREAMVKEIRSAIKEAVARLPEKHRLVYVLSQGQRMSYKQIAAILGCTVGMVGSRKVAAVRKLRKMLEPLRDEFFGNRSQSDQAGALGENSLEGQK